MATSPPPIFFHSFQANGSISSICRHCLVTVATEPNEVNLRWPESIHFCGAFDMRGLAHADSRKPLGYSVNR